MSPPLIVFATSVLRNAPTRLSTAAIATATFGLSAPVAIGVAMALAVSWNPFVKSKKRASAMTSATTTVMSTGVESRTGIGSVKCNSIIEDATPPAHPRNAAAQRPPPPPPPPPPPENPPPDEPPEKLLDPLLADHDPPLEYEVCVTIGCTFAVDE